jgi:antitoxin HigA-1
MLQEEFPGPMGISAYGLAKDLGVPLTRIAAILPGKRTVTADTGLRLDRYFGLTDGCCLRLESESELRAAKRTLGARIAKEVKPRELLSASSGASSASPALPRPVTALRQAQRKIPRGSSVRRSVRVPRKVTATGAAPTGKDQGSPSEPYVTAQALLPSRPDPAARTARGCLQP